MWLELLYYRIWIRDVFWLGPPAPKVLGSDSKTHLESGCCCVLRHFDSAMCVRFTLV